MPYSVKIKGTKYILNLELDGEEWKLSILMDNSIEDQTVISHMSKRILEEKTLDLLDNLPIPLNSIQQELIIKELEKKTRHMFHDDEETSKPEPEMKKSKISKNKNRSVTISGSKTKNRGQDADEMEKVAKKMQSKSKGIQQTVVSEFQQEILGEGEPQEEMKVSEIQTSDDDTEQIQELIRTYREVQDNLKSLDKRVSKLERITYKLAQLVKNLR